MDIGLAFEDEDLACDEKNKKGDRDVPYNVKICTDQWFEEALKKCSGVEIPEDPKDLEQFQTMLKFSADSFYSKRDYTNASQRYAELLGIISPKNASLWKDVQESLSRCYIYSGETEKGLDIAREMVETSSKEDEARQRQALALLSFACEKAKRWAECVNVLERLCELQSQYPQVFHKLGDVYTLLLDVSSGDEAASDISLVKQLSCYLRARYLYQSVMGTVTEFIQKRNSAFINELSEKIQKLPLPDARKQFASEFVQNEMDNQTSVKTNLPTEEKQEKVDESTTTKTFYEKICSWNTKYER